MDISASPSGRPLDILVAMFQGGGNIPLILPIVSRLVSRGHRVRVLAGPGVRASRIAHQSTLPRAHHGDGRGGGSLH